MWYWCTIKRSSDLDLQDDLDLLFHIMLLWYINTTDVSYCVMCNKYSWPCLVGLWMFFLALQQYFSYIFVVSFAEGNCNTWRNPWTQTTDHWQTLWHKVTLSCTEENHGLRHATDHWQTLWHKVTLSCTDRNPATIWLLKWQLPADSLVHFYVPATKWTGHLVLPMAVIPK